MSKARLNGTPLLVEAPASSANLGPGFDSLALALELHLRVRVTPLSAGAEQLVVEGEGAEEIGLDAGNRFLIGLEHGLQAFGLEPPIMRIEMDNQIPLARGLGSSAAATVAGLLAAEAMAGATLGPDRVQHIATDIDGHPDNVAAALHGGFVVVARSSDGVPRCARFDAPARLEAALFVPDRVMRTADMRAALPEHVTHADATHNVGRAALIVAALTSDRTDLLAAMSEDRLHEPYRAAHFPELAQIASAASAAGARGAALSGAGSTVVALCDDSATARRVADAMTHTAHRLGVGGRSLVIRPAQRGARVVASVRA